MDDPSNNYKLPPIIIRSPRSPDGISFDKEKIHQNVKVRIEEETIIPGDINDVIEQKPKNVFRKAKIKRTISPAPLKNDENWSPTVLVIGPGGMKGFLELGALAKLEEQHVLDNVETYFGVSVGSIICLLRTVGYTYQEIAELGSGLNLFNGWDDINLAQIVHQNGVIPHDKLRDFLSGIVQIKMGSVPTFQELYMKTGYVLKVVSYNITAKTTYYFDYRTHPDASVVEIVLASSSIPLLFYKFKYKGDYYCDGAIGNPYPIDKVDDGTTDILGIYISSTPDKNNQATIHWYLDRIIHATMSEYRGHIIDNSSPRCKHLVLYSDIKDVTGMAVDNELRVSMFKSGYIAASNFLNYEDDVIVVESKANNPIPYVPPLRDDVFRESKEYIAAPHIRDDLIITHKGQSFSSRRARSGEVSLSNILGLYQSHGQTNYDPNLSISLDNINMSSKTESKISRKHKQKNRRSSYRSSSKINNYQTGNREIELNNFNPETIKQIENRVMRKLVPLIISGTIKHSLRASNGSRYSSMRGSSKPQKIKSNLDYLISPINIIPPVGKIAPRSIYRH